MSDHNSKYDEITFALFYDNELDEEDARAFEAQLQDDSELMSAYQEWRATLNAVTDHFEYVESTYNLDDFTKKVMRAISDEPSWAESLTYDQSSAEILLENPWWKAWLFPILIGSLAAAAVLIVARSLDTSSQNAQRSTVLINYPDQSGSTQEAPVIWLLDEEEKLEEADEHEAHDNSNDEDI
jgi:negative regulator of sigma E activity